MAPITRIRRPFSARRTTSSPSLPWSVALYYQDFEDYISRSNALNVRDVNGEITTSGLIVNGDAEVWGAELDLTAMLSENWYLGGTLSYSEGEYADGTELPCNEFDDNGAPAIPDGQAVG